MCGWCDGTPSRAHSGACKLEPKKGPIYSWLQKMSFDVICLNVSQGRFIFIFFLSWCDCGAEVEIVPAPETALETLEEE